MKTVALGEIAEIVSGATPKSQRSEYWGGDVPWVTPADLSKLEDAYIAITPRTLTKAGLASCAARVLPAGSVLLSSRAPIGHVAINSVPMATNQGFKSFVPRGDKLDAKYLYHWLRANTDSLQRMGNGATFKELSKSTVERIEVPVPNVDEQRRIAAILDRADDIRQTACQVLAKLRELPSALFRAELRSATSGWHVRRLGDLAEWHSGGTPPRSEPEYFQGDIPWFSSGELGPLYVSEADERVNLETIVRTSAKRVPAGSIMVGMYDTAALKSSIARRDSSCNQAIAFALPDPSIANVIFVYCDSIGTNSSSGSTSWHPTEEPQLVNHSRRIHSVPSDQRANGVRGQN